MQKRSPIKAKPLRHAGESLEHELRDLEDDMLLKYGLYATVALGLMFYEWAKYLTNTPPQPWTVSAVAIPTIAFCTYRFFQLRRRARFLKLGIEGERAVGEFLEKLRAKGYVVFHDIVGDSFNLDHVVLSPKGIYTVETKTRSKPVRGMAKVIHDGDNIIVNGAGPFRNPIIQSLAQANWLTEILQESTGKRFPVKPVVLFPGWYVETTQAGKRSPVWVLNPKALPKFIEHQPQQLNDPDLHLAAFHLSRYIRSASD